jgi:hypothetical protein
MKSKHLAAPMGRVAAMAMEAQVPQGTDLLDWFLNTQVPPGLRMTGVCVMIQPAENGALLRPGQPAVEPVFHFFFEESEIEQ